MTWSMDVKLGGREVLEGSFTRLTRRQIGKTIWKQDLVVHWN